jgi:hypothetical protein
MRLFHLSDLYFRFGYDLDSSNGVFENQDLSFSGLEVDLISVICLDGSGDWLPYRY